MRKLWRAFADLVVWCVFVAHVESIELWSAFNVFAWGAWLVIPTFDVFSRGFYIGMAALAPESVWGGIAIAAAVLQLYGRLTGRRALIRFGATGIAMLWWFADGALMVQNWRFASTITYASLGALSLFVSWRAAVPPRHYREAGYGWDA